MSTVFFLKSLLLLWVFCAVMCEHQKRDTHRIIIKERTARNQKKGRHGHFHGHGHNRSQRHKHSSGGHDRGRKNRGKKEYSSVEKDASLKDAGGNSGLESNVENVLQRTKGHRSHHHVKKFHSQPSSNQNHKQNKKEPYTSNLRINYHNGWIPLSAEQLEPSSQETYKNVMHKIQKNNKDKNKYNDFLEPAVAEVPTSYPFHFDTSSSYPQLSSYSNAFSNYDLNKILELNQSPVTDPIEQLKTKFSHLNDKSNRLNNHRSSYEITEVVPAASDVETVITIPDDDDESKDDSDLQEHATKMEEMKNTHTLVRNRGGMNYRGSKKF